MAGGGERPRKGRATGPIPLDPVDLLAGLAPGIDLHADELPPDESDAAGDGAAVLTVAEVGKMLRSGDDTIRRLIRSPGIEPRAEDAPPADDDELEVVRAGIVPRTRTRPGE